MTNTTEEANKRKYNLIAILNFSKLCAINPDFMRAFACEIARVRLYSLTYGDSFGRSFGYGRTLEIAIHRWRRMLLQ